MCQAAIPLLTKVRGCLSVLPGTKGSIASSILSADQLTKALRSIERQGRFIDIEKVAGSSYKSLLSQCMDLSIYPTESSTDKQQLICRLSQLNIINAIFIRQAAQKSLAAYASKRALTWSVQTVKNLLAFPDHASVPALDSNQTFTGAARFWNVLLISASKYNDRILLEATECNLLFLYETWSVESAKDEDLGMLFPRHQ